MEANFHAGLAEIVDSIRGNRNAECQPDDTGAVFVFIGSVFIGSDYECVSEYAF
jgi:hypothetical protein